jgi:hypothetical protein
MLSEGFDAWTILFQTYHAAGIPPLPDSGKPINKPITQADNYRMRKTALLIALLCLLLAGEARYTNGASPALTMTHVPVFRRELMQSQLENAYGEIDRQWGAPMQHLVLNSYCDGWRALHAKSYPVQAIPGHWLPQAKRLGYTVLVGLTTDGAQALLLTRARTDEQLKSLLIRHKLAAPDRLSAVTGIGTHYVVTELGIDYDNITLAEMPYDDMPLLNLVQGKFEAALTSPSVYTRMQSTLKQDIRVISISSPMARAAFVVAPASLGDADIVRLRNLMFEVNTRASSYNYRYVSPDELAKFEHDGPAVDSSQCPLPQ